jgi:hypothetical protein
MPSAPIADVLARVCPDEMRDMLFYLAKDPLPYRKLNFTLPGHDKCTLHEADDYIAGRLESWGYSVEREPVQVQAYRRDETKHIMHQYSAPAPEDPWYTAYNLYAKKTGTELPEEIIVVISHKDSQSWINSPGANDNCIGTVGNLAVAQALAGVPTRRSVWFIFCNEEHTPWTSETAARNAAERGDKIVAVFNLDGLGVRSAEKNAAGRRTHVTAFSLPEGERMADVQAEVNEELGLGLECAKVQREHPNDDDGSYVKAGYPAAAIIIGSFPYEDPNYHQPGDTAERVDVDSAALSTRLVVASVLRIAENGLGA